MQIKFKNQSYQEEAVKSVVDCFSGQEKQSLRNYEHNIGFIKFENKNLFTDTEAVGFKNAEFSISQKDILQNLQEVQKRQGLSISQSLKSDDISKVNLDIEMETGTGKTYVYIKSIFELNKLYGWSKFIIVVPSIAIREGVKQSFELTASHFQNEYKKRARNFIYNSSNLHEIEIFATSNDIQVMIINIQAFNTKAQDARRIYEELDSFNSRRPIDIIKATKPILILDEPQKMEGAKTLKSFESFDALMVLRYSATHKKEYNKVHRLDALDAYNQKLVKKIAVRGISVKGLGGTKAYIYLQSIEISQKKPPFARMELEKRLKNDIKRVVKNIYTNDNLFDISNELDQYKGFVVSQIDGYKNIVTFSNGLQIKCGEASGDIAEDVIRKIQIRESIKAHFQKEENLFHKGIKVLSLFFIDQVAKYRKYDDVGEIKGEYAEIFENEYNDQLKQILENSDEKYAQYLKNIKTQNTHNGYFSIDKKSKRFQDSSVKTRGEMKGESDDVDAYELILKDKKRLLSFDEPTRFIFSHSALREGWDNPNIFVICTLKHSDNTISRRQEVGRGMRICVDKNGDRVDGELVHDVNVLTVVTNESYESFVLGLQEDISQSLSQRPQVANKEYFLKKSIQTQDGLKNIDEKQATAIYRYLLKNDYVDDNDKITSIYYDDFKNSNLADFPKDLIEYKDGIIKLINSLFSDELLPKIENDRNIKTNKLNDNFSKKEFKELWSKINKKAIYKVEFNSDELIEKSIKAINNELQIKQIQYKLTSGVQKDEINYDKLTQGKGFKTKEQTIANEKKIIEHNVKYDLIGKISSQTKLTRKSIGKILTNISKEKFSLLSLNPESFISEVSRLINEQKATLVVEKITYDKLDESYSEDIFTLDKTSYDINNMIKTKKHIYEYVYVDSKNEREFVDNIDKDSDVIVYSKLPKGFQIPTPFGSYNPDWAIAFEKKNVKYVYFIAETKGTMSSMQLRQIEKGKIKCAKEFFEKITTSHIKYEQVDTYENLMNIVKC